MRMSWTKTLGEAAGVILVALFLAGAAYVLRPELRPMAAGNPPVESGSGKRLESAKPLITLEDARSHFQAGKALFADARPLKAYQQGHIKGAMHLDPNEFDTWSESFFSQFPADTMIIAYCDGPQCPLSAELAEKLTWLGYEKISVLKNGWHLWTAAQLPTEQVAE